MTNNAIPDFFGARVSLEGIFASFVDLMPNHSMVDIGETIRVMLADYFYSDELVVPYQTIKMFDRTLVIGFNMFIPVEDHVSMMEIAGDIFWAMADTINRSAMLVYEDDTGSYEYHPFECYYTFDANRNELLVYLPDKGFKINGAAPMDGRAVLTATRNTWPKYMVDKLTQPHSNLLAEPIVSKPGMFGGADF